MQLAVIGSNLYVGLFENGFVALPTAGGNATPIAPLVDAPDAFFQVPFVFDESNLYWSEVSLAADTTGGPIGKAPIGGGSPAVLGTSTGYAAGLAVDAEYLYWIDQDHGTVNRLPLAGGSASIVASGLVTPGGLALKAGTLYLSDAAGDLLSVPASGGSVTTLFAGPGLPANTIVEQYSPPIVADDHNVYFSVCYQQVGLYRIPLSNGSAPTLLANACAGGMAVDADQVYWIDQSNRVSSVPIAGGSPRVVWTLDTSLAGGLSAGPVVDATNVYWGVAPQAGFCGFCAPPPKGQINAIMTAPKSTQ